MVVYQCCKQVVCGANRVQIPCKVQVDVLHGDNLCIAATRRAAFYAEYRAQRRLTQAKHRLFAQRGKGICQPYAGGGFSLARRGGANRGNKNELAIRLPCHTCDKPVVDFRFIAAVRGIFFLLQA